MAILDFNYYFVLATAVVAVIACALLFRFTKERLKYDGRLFVLGFGFIVLGSAIEILAEQRGIKLFFLHSPFNYLTFALLFGIIYFIFSRVKKTNVVLLVPYLVSFFVHWKIPRIFCATENFVFCWYPKILLGFLVLNLGLYKLAGKKYFLEVVLVFSQVVDAVITIIGLRYFGFREINYFSSFILGVSPVLFLVLKIVVPILAVWAIRDIKEENLRNFVLIALVLAGAGPAIRNSINILLTLF